MKTGFTHESTYNESVEWYTPPAVFAALGLTYDLDPASPGAEIVPWVPAARHLTPMENGLAAKWTGRVWLNPPYSGETARWLARFVEQGDGIMLVFARTDTVWFHDVATRADAMLFVRRRICFISGARGLAPLRKDWDSRPGAGSLMLAMGAVCIAALRQCGLGLFIDLQLQRKENPCPHVDLLKPP